MRTHRLEGQLTVPGDKSVSHRALIFAALTSGLSIVSGLSPADDCRSTMNCLRAIGLNIQLAPDNPDSVSIMSPGIFALKKPVRTLYAGNSGTTIRLLSGLCAGQKFITDFDGDDSLRRRPMARVLDPLSSMGAQVTYSGIAGCPPFALKGGQLTGCCFNLTVPSAQVETAILLAGLQAEGNTTVTTGSPMRDHTRRLFQQIGVPHLHEGNALTVTRLPQLLPPFQVTVPGDISSAAFFIAAAASLPGSRILLPGVGVNPGRRLIVDVLKSMGASISFDNPRSLSGEPIADITVEWSRRLGSATIGQSEIASGIDEIPILAVAGAFCDGTFTVEGASELKVKESDRLSLMVSNLKAAGAEVQATPDGFVITGKASLPGGSLWKTGGDHRLSMSGMIAGLLCEKELTIDDPNCVAVSYPNFKSDLGRLLA